MTSKFTITIPTTSSAQYWVKIRPQHGNDVIKECSITSSICHSASIRPIGIWSQMMQSVNAKCVPNIIEFVHFYLSKNVRNISDDLLVDSSSFIYGQSPSTGSVPIYAKVNLCNSPIFEDQQQENGTFLYQTHVRSILSFFLCFFFLHFLAELHLNLIDSKSEYRRSTYIPVSSPLLQNNVWNKSRFSDDAKNSTSQNTSFSREKRELSSIMETANNETDTPNGATTTNSTDEVDVSIDGQRDNSTDEMVNGPDPPNDSENANTQTTHTEQQNYPHFHVTYWMFYPYSQVISDLKFADTSEID